MNGTAIAMAGLTHCFGKRTAVDDLQLKVPTGTVCGFLGRNGAGKTTTIQVLMNLLQPTAGRVEVLGLDPARDFLELRRQVGYVAENPVLYGWMKVRELVWFTGQFYDTWNPDKVEGLIDRFGLDPEQKVKHLSRGMNAQLALALALGHEPRLLILDEPAMGLDVLVRRDFLESIIGLIQEEGRTVFLSSHLVHEVERVADRVAIIHQGRLVAEGTVDEVKQSVKRVVVRLCDEAGELTGIAGLRQVQGEGAQRLLTVVGYGEAQAARIEAQGGRVLDVLDLSLEEAFVSHVRLTVNPSSFAVERGTGGGLQNRRRCGLAWSPGWPVAKPPISPAAFPNIEI